MMPTSQGSQASTSQSLPTAASARRRSTGLRAAMVLALVAHLGGIGKADAQVRPIKGSSLAGKKPLAPKAGKLKKSDGQASGGMVHRSVTVDSTTRERGILTWDIIKTEGYMEGDELMFMRQTASQDIEPLMAGPDASEGKSKSKAKAKAKAKSKDRGLRAALEKAQVFQKSRVSPSLLPVEDDLLYKVERGYRKVRKSHDQLLRELPYSGYSDLYSYLQQYPTLVYDYETTFTQVMRSQEEILSAVAAKFPAEKFAVVVQNGRYQVARNTTIPVSTSEFRDNAYVQETDRDEALARNPSIHEKLPAAGRIKVFRGDKKIGEHMLPYDRRRATSIDDRSSRPGEIRDGQGRNQPSSDLWINANNLYVSPVYENDDGQTEAVLLGLAAFPIGLELYVVDLTAVKEGRAKPGTWKVKASTTSGSLRVVLTGAKPGHEYSIIERVGEEPLLSGRTLTTVRLPEPNHPLVKKHGMSYLPAKEFAARP